MTEVSQMCIPSLWHKPDRVSPLTLDEVRRDLFEFLESRQSNTCLWNKCTYTVTAWLNGIYVDVWGTFDGNVNHSVTESHCLNLRITFKRQVWGRDHVWRVPQFKEGCVSQWLLSPLSLIILLCVSHKWNTVSRLKSLFSGEAKQLQAELTFGLICLDCSWLYGLWSFLTFSIIFRILRILWNIVFTSCCLWLQPGWRTWTCSTEQNTSPSHRC